MKPIKFLIFFAIAFLFLFSTSFLCPEDEEEDKEIGFSVTPTSGHKYTAFNFEVIRIGIDCGFTGPFWTIRNQNNVILDNPDNNEDSFTYIFPEAGIYNIELSSGSCKTSKTIQVTDDHGDIPEAIAKVTPEQGIPGTTFIFDASDSWDIETPADQLLVRWFSSQFETEFDLNKVYEHVAEDPGGNVTAKYSVTLIVKDEEGVTDDTTIFFTVTSNPGLPCPDVPYLVYGGQTYNTVQIGEQCWFRENLNIGERIDAVVFQKDNGKIEKWCYDNLPANCETYGGLYQWDEMMQYTTTEGAQGICPEGWHIPVYDDFDELAMSLGGQEVAGGKLKAITHWKAPNTGATNESGFTALPAGLCISYGEGDYLFQSLTDKTSFYGSYKATATHYGAFGLVYISDNFMSDNDTYHLSAKSVRCIKDQTKE